MAKRGQKAVLPQEPGAVRQIGVRMASDLAEQLRKAAGGPRKTAGYLRAIVERNIDHGELLPAAVGIPEDAAVDVVTVRLVADVYGQLVDLAGGERLVAGRIRGLIQREVQNDGKTKTSVGAAR